MRINRSNPEPSGAQQPAVQPQTAAPQQPAPRREEPRQEPPKPKKEKPKKRPEPEEYEAYEEDEEEKPRRRFPVGCLIVLVILALVGFGGYKVSQFYAELDGQGTLGEVQTITVPEGSSVSSIATQLKDSGIIQYDWLFKQYVKYSGKAGEIQYGSFEVQSGMAYNEIIKALPSHRQCDDPRGHDRCGRGPDLCRCRPCGGCGHLPVLRQRHRWLGLEPV